MRVHTGAVVCVFIGLLTGCGGSYEFEDRYRAAVEETELQRLREKNHRQSAMRQEMLEEHPLRHTTSGAQIHTTQKRHVQVPIGGLHRTRLREAELPQSSGDAISGGEKVDLHFNDTPLRIVAKVLASLTQSNIVVADEVASKGVTLRATDVPWREILAVIAQSQQCEIRDVGGIVSIQPRRESDSSTTDSMAQSIDLLQFSHVAPEDMQQAVLPLFADRANKPVMSVDERTGSLVIKARPDDIDLIAALAQQLDRPVRQILIETFIVEANQGLERSLGTRLGIDRLDSGGVVRVGGIVGPADDRVAVDLPLTAPAGGLSFLLDSDRLRLELTALEQEGKTRIISNPRIFTLNGREAVIFQGDEVPYTSVSDNGTQTEFKEAGVRLAVTPAIVGSGRLILDVTVNKDTVDTRIPNPPITRRQMQTRLLVADGAMVILGGIYFDTQVNAETRVPLFGKLPVLGHLFKRSQKTRDFKELLVFIAPKIVDGSI